MPKRKPTRSQRRRGPPAYTQRPAPPPAPRPTSAPAPTLDPLAPITAVDVGPVAPAEQVREHVRDKAISRFSARDYSYVKRELRRILILATAIIIAIILLSFFIP